MNKINSVESHIQIFEVHVYVKTIPYLQFLKKIFFNRLDIEKIHLDKGKILEITSKISIILFNINFLKMPRMLSIGIVRFRKWKSFTI